MGVFTVATLLAVLKSLWSWLVTLATNYKLELLVSLNYLLLFGYSNFVMKSTIAEAIIAFTLFLTGLLGYKLGKGTLP